MKSETKAFVVNLLLSRWFLILWHDTFVTRSIPNILGITIGISIALSYRFYFYIFLIIYLYIFFIVYLCISITEVFKNDKKLYKKLDVLFTQNEVSKTQVSCWKTFKELYLETEISPVRTGVSVAKGITATSLLISWVTVATGWDQIVRWGLENSVNSMVDSSHEWTKIKIVNPLDT